MTTLTGIIGSHVGNDGQSASIALDRQTQIKTARKHTDASRRGNMYIAASTAAVTTTVALATTYTGLCISNPAGSGKVLSILGARFALSVAPAAIASLHLIGGYSAAGVVTHTTPLASPGIQNCKIGAGETSVANADAAATIVAPAYLLPLANGFTAGALPGGDGWYQDLEGMFTLTPGGWIAIGTLTVAVGFGAIIWEEYAE